MDTIMRFAMTIGVCVLVSACSALYKDVIDEYGKNYDGAATILNENLAAMETISRRRTLENKFNLLRKDAITRDDRLDGDDVNNGPVPQTLRDRISAFAVEVCTRSALLTKERGAIQTLDIYNKTLKKINKQPDAEIGPLLASIYENVRNTKYDDLVLKPKLPAQIDDAACQEEVGRLVILPSQTVPEAAVLAGMLAALDLVKAIEKAAVGVLALVDDFIRAERLAAYIKNSETAVAQQFMILREDDLATVLLCKSLGSQADRLGNRRAEKAGTVDERPCLPEVTVSDNKPVLGARSSLAAAHVARQWSAIRTAWHAYDALLAHRAAAEAARSSRASSLDLAIYRYEMDRHIEVFAVSVNDYRAQQAGAAPVEVVDAMAKAQETLRRIANGNLTLKEGWGVLVHIGDTLSDWKKNADAVRTGAEGLPGAFAGTE